MAGVKTATRDANYSNSNWKRLDNTRIQMCLIEHVVAEMVPTPTFYSMYPIHLPSQSSVSDIFRCTVSSKFNASQFPHWRAYRHFVMKPPSSLMPEANTAYPTTSKLAFMVTAIPTCHRFCSRSVIGNDKNQSHSNATITMQNDVPRFSRRLIISLLPLIPLAYTVDAADSIPEDAGIVDGFQKLPCKGENCRPVEVHDFRIGTGRQVNLESTVVLKWTGRLADRYGWPYQREEGDEVSFDLTREPLIDGFVQGILGMKEGGKRRILIPGELGYKDEHTGPLPRDFGDRRRLFATVLNKRRFVRAGDLVIDVQLKKVRSLK